MKLNQSYNHNFKGVNTEMIVTVEYIPEHKEVEYIDKIEIIVNGKVVAEITSIVHDFFSEIEDKIHEDENWAELAYEKNIPYEVQ